MSIYVIVRAVLLLLLLLLGVADYFFLEVHILYYILPLVLYLSLLGIGSANMRLNFFTKAYTRLNTKEKAIALTFDDGPSPEYTPQILKLLEQYNAKATFFCIGKNIEKAPELAKRIIEKGHTIGNHSYSHSNFFSFFGKNTIVKEINKTNQLIKEVSGEECTIFRPPYGVTNPPIAKAIRACQMKVIGWNIRSFDTSTKDYTKVVKRVISRIKPGSVVLLHDDRANTVKILESILRYTRENNYKYLHVQDLLK